MFQSVTKRFKPIPVKLSQKSEVVPDMSFTPREILQKFSRGEKVPLGFNGKYDSEDDQDHLSDFEQCYFEDDPTRSPDFDRFDYAEEQQGLKARQIEAKRRSKVKALEASKREASAEKSSESEAPTRETTSEEAPKPSAIQPTGD